MREGFSLISLSTISLYASNKYTQANLTKKKKKKLSKGHGLAHNIKRKTEEPFLKKGR